MTNPRINGGFLMTQFWMKSLLVPFLIVVLVACPPIVTDKITNVDASATPATIASAATSSLTATVSGTGTFNAAVSWSIVSGGGSLSSSTGGTVTYTAPTVTASTPVQIKATAAGDSSVSKTVQVTVNPSTSTGTLTLNIAGPFGLTAFVPNVSVSGVGTPITSLGEQSLTVPVGDITVSVNSVTKAGAFVDRVFSGYIFGPNNLTSTTVSITQGAVTKMTVLYDDGGFSGQVFLTYSSQKFYGIDDTVLAGPSGIITPVSSLATGTNYDDIAFDKSGNLWITDGGANVVQKWSKNQYTSPLQTITANSKGSIGGPVGLAFDAQGNLWVSNYFKHTLVRYNKSVIDTATGTNALEPDAIIDTVGGAGYQQIAFDAAGNLWAVDYRIGFGSPDYLYKFDAAKLTANPAPSVTATLQVDFSSGITFDSAGKLWITDNGGVKKYDPPTADGKPTPLLTLDRPSPHFQNPSATAFDKLGNLWVHDNDGIYEFTLAQITTPKTTLELVPDQKLVFGSSNNYTLRFYPVPANLPLYH
jgi:sugar lactone lactonase YvrE